MVKLGVIKEGKVPQDVRVPLIPEHLAELVTNFQEFEVKVENSDSRCYKDTEYKKHSIDVVEDVSAADILLGVKEVPIPNLIADKTYLFFSHTIKKQPYNRKLLQEILKKNITLLDYEVLTDTNGIRIVAFGRYAGIVGAYNGLLTYGKKYQSFNIRRAHECFDFNDLANEYQKINLPPIKIALTGSGRVANGACEVLDGANIKKVSPIEFLNNTYDEAVYTQLYPEHYNQHKEGLAYTDEHFFANPTEYKSSFLPYTKVADMLIAGAYWDPKAPVLFTKDDVKSPEFKIRVIADITCDIEGSVPTTLRATTIDEPFYDYDRIKLNETTPFSSENNITVMSIDNLPNELPRNASHDFSEQLTSKVLPSFVLGDKEGVLERATITKNGKLTDRFAYLQDYVDGK